MFRNYFQILIILISPAIYTQEIPSINHQEIKVLKVGTGESDLGFNEALGEGGGFAGPSYFTFSDDGFLYVHDYINAKINIYDESFGFVSAIPVIKKFKYTVFKKMWVDSQENVLILTDMKGVVKLDHTGQTTYVIPQSELPDDTEFEKNIFLVDDKLLLYPTYNSESKKIKMIDGNGKYFSEEEMSSYLAMNLLAPSADVRVNKVQSDRIFAEKKSQQIITNRNRILNSDIKMHRKLFGIESGLDIEKSDLSRVRDVKNADIFNRIRSATLKGFDNHGNSYWLCIDKKDYKIIFMVTLSAHGELLDYFTTPALKFARVVIAPNGNIYFMKSEKTGIHIYTLQKRI